MQKLKELRAQIAAEWISLCAVYGFNYHNPLPLLIDFDPTLIFTNCSICIFKKYYLNKQICPNYVTVQKSLRTNTYKIIHSAIPLKYNSSLYVCGGFFNTSAINAYNDFTKCVIMQIDFLKRYLTPDLRLLIKFNVDLIKFLDISAIEKHICENIIITFTDCRDTNSLVWKYGLDNIVGVGSSWELTYTDSCSKVTSSYFGNVILLLLNDHIIGIDFGGTIEALIQAVYYCNNKLCACYFFSDYFEQRVIFYKYNDLFFKYLDSLYTIIEILFTVDIKNSYLIRLDFTLEKYVSALVCLLVLNSVSEREFYEDFYEMASKIFPYKNSINVVLSCLMDLFKYWDLNIIVENRHRIIRNSIKGNLKLSELQKATILKIKSSIIPFWLISRGGTKEEVRNESTII